MSNNLTPVERAAVHFLTTLDSTDNNQWRFRHDLAQEINTAAEQPRIHIHNRYDCECGYTLQYVTDRGFLELWHPGVKNADLCPGCPTCQSVKDCPNQNKRFKLPVAYLTEATE